MEKGRDGVGIRRRRNNERDQLIKCFDKLRKSTSRNRGLSNHQWSIYLSRSNNLCSSIITFQEISPSTTKVQLLGANQN